MKKFLPLLALVALTTSLAAQGGAPNTLTAKEKAEGWKLLFDGATLNNFVPQGKALWKVADGALKPEGAGGWLATKEDFTNFQLHVEFRTSAPDINSGVFLRRGRQDGDSHQIGYELQIRNPSPGDKPFDGKEGNHNAYYTGSFSGHLKSKNEPVIEMGKWNTVELTAQGDHFIVVINGNKVLDDHQADFKSGMRNFTTDLRNARAAAIANSFDVKCEVDMGSVTLKRYQFYSSRDNGTTWTPLQLPGTHGATNATSGNIKQFAFSVWAQSFTGLPDTDSNGKPEIVYHPNGAMNLASGSTNATLVLATDWKKIAYDRYTINLSPSGQFTVVGSHT